jgi:hypothetical protein
MNLEAITFLDSYCDFSNPHWVWILTGMSRNKDNANGKHSYLQRLVLTCPNDILECYNRLHIESNDPDTTYRMYISLNARDAVKTTFAFQRKLLEIGYGLAKGQDDALQLSKRIGSLWKTELGQSNNRATKRVLVDIDTNDCVLYTKAFDYLKGHLAVIKTTRKTPNGYHIVIEACDTRAFVKYCKEQGIVANGEEKAFIQRDSLVFVEQWGGIS